MTARGGTARWWIVLWACLLIPACGGGGGGGGGGGDETGLAVTGISPGTLASEHVVPFTITGREFAPVGGTASVRLTASSGTPFLGGTTATRSFTATIDSSTQMSGATRSCGVADDVSARVTIVLPDTTEASSSSAIATIHAPRTTLVVPSVIPSSLPIRIRVEGSLLGNQGEPVTIRFTAPSGTPFLGQTSATLEVTSIGGNATSIYANMPWDATRLEFVADTTCLWPSGAESHLPNSVVFRPELVLLEGTGLAGNEGGTSVAIDGDYAVVGSPEDGSWGSAQVFVRTAGGWARQARLIPSDGPAGGNFGTSVAISGDSILVGCPFGGGGVGAAYVFVRSGVVWREEQRIVPFDGSNGDRFGASVALNEDLAVVGAPSSILVGESGQAWAFTRSGTTWSEQRRFQPGTAGNVLWHFGWSVAIMPSSGGTFVFIGAPGGTDPNGSDPGTFFDTGSVFVYSRVLTSWFQRAWFHSEQAVNGDRFGTSVSAHDETLVIGAPGDDHLLTLDDSGSIYVYEGSAANPGTWTEQQRLWSPTRVADGAFGTAVAAQDEYLVVGAPGETGLSPATGAVHVYDRATGDYVHALKLRASDGRSGDEYGAAVDVDGMTVLVGAPGNDGEGAEAGQAYIH